MSVEGTATLSLRKGGKALHHLKRSKEKKGEEKDEGGFLGGKNEGF